MKIYTFMYMEERTDNEYIESIQQMVNKEKKSSNKDEVFIGKPSVNNTRKKILKIKGKDISTVDAMVSNKKPIIIGEELTEHPRMNETYADVLDRLSILMNKKGDNMRSRVYSRAQDTILGLSEDITDSKQLEGKSNIGPTIVAKLEEYSKTGTLSMFDREKENPEIWLTDIYGIGPKRAQELVKKGINNIDQLRERKEELLNDIQRIGLQYYDDILKRIPRTEIEDYNKIFENTFNSIRGDGDSAEYEIVGSYRRGAKTSGDIDVIVTSSRPDIFTEFIDKLKNDNIIIETLSYGKTKSMVIARLPGYDVARRVDFMYTPTEEYPFAILYFTGSKAFNTSMRGYALKLGISLNEHGMYVKPKGKEKGDKIDKLITSEEGIFDSLYLKYKHPEERVDSRALESTLPIIPDTGVEKKGQSCYKSCDIVPTGQCVTGCSPSWTDKKMVNSRNWCTCNLDKTDCISTICPLHGEPNAIVKTKPIKIRKTKKITGSPNPDDPSVKKPRKTKKIKGSPNPDDPSVKKPRKTKKIKGSPNPDDPSVKNPRKTKKKSPEKIKDVVNPTNTTIIMDKGSIKVRKTGKKIKIAGIAPKLTIAEPTNDAKPAIVVDDINELVPILHLNKPGTPIKVNPDINSKPEKNIKLKEDNVSMTDVKKNIHNFLKDGISVIEELTEAELADIVKAANHAYHNAKTVLLSDNEYDIVKEYMERKYPSNTILDEIGAKLIKHKVDLPYKMASMDKIKPDSKALVNWTQKYSGPYILSCKLDGVSGLYTTEGDEPKLYTRGNGSVGQDVSHLLSVLNLPIEKDIVVRGEFLIPRIIFDEKYKDKFANPRNMVAGIVNSKKVDDKAKDIHFVTYEVIKPSIKPSEQLAKLEELNYEVVQNKQMELLTNETLSELLMDWRTNHEYEIDGVIVTDDHIHPRKDGNPDFAFAFKMVMSDQIAEAKVVDVIWTPSKSGYLKPRVRIEPIRLGGVTIEYATGFNGRFIEEHKIGIGAVIQLIRSGDVIPYIKSVTTPAEVAKMPHVPYHWTDSHVDIVLDNINDDMTVQEKNLTDFFKTGLEVDGLGAGNMNKIMKAGYTTIPEILHMSKEDFAKVGGFKEKMVNKIYNGIQTQIEKASLVTIMAASNKFGRGMGARKIAPIMEKYPNILTTGESIDEKTNMLLLVDGIGKENAKSFASNISIFLEFLDQCNLRHKMVDSSTDIVATNTLSADPDRVIDQTNPLYKKHIVMTKVRDKDIIDRLTSTGGILDDTISKKTFILIVKSLDDI
jgi:DNA ligase (NAD+)